MVPYLTLPNGFRIPSIGFGTAAREPEFEQSLDSALEVGYRHFDTAYVYKTEAVIGRVLKKWFNSGKLKREDIFITSKYDPAHEDLETQVNKGLADLGLDYIDLYLIHHPSDAAENIKIWKKMEELVDNGKVKYIGISNFSVQQIKEILNIARIKPVNLQIKVHLYGQQKELVEFCKKNDITIVAYSPLGAPGRKFGPQLDILENETLKKIATKYNKSAGQTALRYLFQNGIIPIPKSKSPERQKANLDIFDFSLSDEDMKALESLDKEMNEYLPPPNRRPKP